MPPCPDEKMQPNWRIVAVCNFDRENVPDEIEEDDLTHAEATQKCETLCNGTSSTSPKYYFVRHKSVRLKGGMADLV